MAERYSLGKSGKTRRSFLAAAGTGATLGVAGCLDDIQGVLEGENNLRMRTSTAETAAYGANEGIATVVNDQTDDLYVEAQTSSGTEANIGALQDEDAEMVYIQNWSAREIAEGVEPFDDLDFEVAQIFHFYDLPWFFCTPDEDLASITDIGDGTNVSPTPEGSGTAPALEYALEAAGATDFDRVSYDFGEQGSAMQEGQLDVGMGTYMNLEIVPGWLQEMMGTVDLHVVEVGDDVLEEWEGDDRILVESFDGDEIEEAASTPDEIHCPSFSYNFVSRADLDYDTVYTFLEVMHEQRDALVDYSELLARLQEDEFWVENMYDGLPFHAAAADFYEEIGVWQDEFERAEE